MLGSYTTLDTTCPEKNDDVLVDHGLVTLQLIYTTSISVSGNNHVYFLTAPLHFTYL